MCSGTFILHLLWRWDHPKWSGILYEDFITGKSSFIIRVRLIIFILQIFHSDCTNIFPLYYFRDIKQREFLFILFEYLYLLINTYKFLPTGSPKFWINIRNTTHKMLTSILSRFTLAPPRIINPKTGTFYYSFYAIVSCTQTTIISFCNLHLLHTLFALQPSKKMI